MLDPRGRVATAEDAPEPVPALPPAVDVDLTVEVVACLLTRNAGQDVNLVAECGERGGGLRNVGADPVGGLGRILDREEEELQRPVGHRLRPRRGG